MVEPRVITAPVREPITEAEAQAALRIASLSASDSNLLAIYIESERRYAEQRTGRTFNQTTLEWPLDSFPAGEIILPRATPLISVSSIIYRDSDGAYTTVSSSDYVLDTTAIPGKVAPGYNKTWPSFTAYPLAPIKITYIAGAAETSPVTTPSIDARIKTLLFLLVAHRWENREGVVVQDAAKVSQAELDYGIEALISELLVDYVC